MSDNKRIAQNTLFLYFRMFLIMGVTLFMSRVALDKLGADDFGLYGVVGGVVGALGFLNATLSSSTSRFITYALGKNDRNGLNLTFNTAFYSHVVLAIIVLIILETIGLWFLYNKLVIPEDRIYAASIVYQLSLITCFVSVTQVPYTADIIAHEKMGIYAYISIFEALAKLLVVYLLVISPYDKLIVYAFLLMIVQLLVAISYRYYCIKNFTESRLHLIFDKNIFKQLLSFSGWNLTANVAQMLKNQGVIILINMFFQPAVVAAQAIGNQISHAMMQFVTNVRTAVNPQIIKLYAAGDYEASKRLTLSSTVYVFDLLLLLGLPIILLMEPILNLWLVKVPPYTVVFAQFIIIQEILGNYNASFYTPMLASGKVKKNSIAAVVVSFTQFAVMYIVLKFGGGVMWVPYLALIGTIIWSFFIKPYILYKDINYSIPELVKCYWDSMKVLIASLLILLPLNYLLNDTPLHNLILLVISLFVISLFSFSFMDKFTQKKLLQIISKKLFQKFHF